MGWRTNFTRLMGGTRNGRSWTTDGEGMRGREMLLERPVGAFIVGMVPGWWPAVLVRWLNLASSQRLMGRGILVFDGARSEWRHARMPRCLAHLGKRLDPGSQF